MFFDQFVFFRHYVFFEKVDTYQFFSCKYCRWWNSKKTIAVVTGGNRGIGFEISRQLASHGISVVLTSRDSEVGIEAVKVLQEVGLSVEFHQLDIVDPQSIEEFADWIKATHGGLDILV